MTKIEEFEQSLIKNGMFEKDYAEYEKLLKRVQGNFLRLQHCYTTAVRFPRKHSDQAVELIKWGLEKYPNTWFPTYTAYYDIGLLHERCGSYQQAYEAYLKADRALGEDRISYRRSLTGNLLWMLLHIGEFHYSEQLEKYYELFNEIEDFKKEFVNNAYRLAIARIVISLHYERDAAAKQAYQDAIGLSKPGFVSGVQGILTHHRAKDILRNTPECTRFLKSLRL